MNDRVMKFNWFLNKIKNAHDRVLEFSSSDSDSFGKYYPQTQQ